MSTTLKIRRGTSSHMSDRGSSVLLQSGELFAEYQSDNSVKLKLGDGETLYNELPYITSPVQDGNFKRSKARYLVSVMNWSDTADENGYYTYLLYLTSLVNMDYNPNIYLTGADDNTIYTDTEETQYGYLKRYDLVYKDKLVLYANTKPDADFYIFVEGDILFSLDDYFDPITHIATEENFLKFLALKYYSSSLIGYKVQLSNTTEYNNGIWVIADVNHDSENTGQSDCYDLISENIFYKTAFRSSAGQDWRDSIPRTWLNGNFYNGFNTDIKERMMNLKYNSNDTWYEDDKVILPSAIEVNCNVPRDQSSNLVAVEGIKYPVFESGKPGRTKYIFGTETANFWYLRSAHTASTSAVWIIGNDGTTGYATYMFQYYLAAIIRIS